MADINNIDDQYQNIENIYNEVQEKAINIENIISSQSSKYFFTSFQPPLQNNAIWFKIKV